MLGLSAGDAFGFDMVELRKISEKVGPTPEDLGQLGDGKTAQALIDKWEPVKKVGRHCLTGHDFSVIGDI
jgi:hypothetical protein